MEPKEIEILIQLAEEKKQAIEAVIENLHKMLSESQQSRSRQRRRRSGGGQTIPATVKKIQKCLERSNHLMSPSDIYDMLESDGVTIQAASLRNYLRRFKGQLFESPERGKWKLKGKVFDGNSEGEKTVVDKDDDLPF